MLLCNVKTCVYVFCERRRVLPATGNWHTTALNARGRIGQ